MDGIDDQFEGKSAEELDTEIESPYSDLAVEATALMRGDAHTEVPGVRHTEEQHGEANVTWVEVMNDQGAHAIGKPIGNYITIDAPGLRRRNRQLQKEIGALLTEQLAKVMPLAPDASVLVVGLGNWNATPDALGPRVVSKLLVTRHLRDYVPAEVAGGLRSVAAIAPGVLGITGIETAEIIHGIVQHIKPTMVISIDALAARSVERIGTTVQVADTGISPGSGIGNQRKGLNKDTLGVPVIAIGVPTVVHASTIAHDVMEALAEEYRAKKAFFQLFATPGERRQMVNQVLKPAVGELVVTPKEVDDLIEDMSKVIAGSLNAVLHTSVTSKQLLTYLE